MAINRDYLATTAISFQLLQLLQLLRLWQLSPLVSQGATNRIQILVIVMIGINLKLCFKKTEPSQEMVLTQNLD